MSDHRQIEATRANEYNLISFQITHKKPQKLTKMTYEEQANKQINVRQNITFIQYENMGPMCARNA